MPGKISKFFIIALFGLLSSFSVDADIYSYTAKDQTIHISNRAQDKKYKKLLRTNKHQPRKTSRSIVSVPKNRIKYNSLINKTAKKHQVEPRLIHAIIQTESAYNPVAISSAGAVGLMQLMPQTARRFGVKNRKDPQQNITGGIRFLKYLMHKFRSNLPLVIAAYNAGENAVIKYKDIPPYPETRNYVIRVLSLYLKT